MTVAIFIQGVVDWVLDSGQRKVAPLGLSLRVCDPDVTLGRLVGRKRAYIGERVPHLAQLLDDDWQARVDLLGLEAVAAARRPWAPRPSGVAVG